MLWRCLSPYRRLFRVAARNGCQLLPAATIRDRRNHARVVRVQSVCDTQSASSWPQYCCSPRARAQRRRRQRPAGPSKGSAYPNKWLFLGAGSRSSVPPVVAPIRGNGLQRSASGRSFSLTPQANPRFWPDSRSTKIVGADGSSPPPDTLFVQVSGLRRCFWCPHGCHPRR